MPCCSAKHMHELMVCQWSPSQQILLHYCCSNSNAVIAAVNKSLQAALVFFLSSAFFCGHDAAQCLNGMKIASALIVCVAILLYSSASFPACEWPAWCACSKYRSLPEE